MAHSVSAQKRVRQNERRRLMNKSLKTAYRSEIRKLITLAAKGNVEGATSNVAAAMKKIDKAAKKRSIHRNAAARYKSRLHRAINRAKKQQTAPAK